MTPHRHRTRAELCAMIAKDQADARAETANDIKQGKQAKLLFDKMVSKCKSKRK